MDTFVSVFTWYKYQLQQQRQSARPSVVSVRPSSSTVPVAPWFARAFSSKVGGATLCLSDPTFRDPSSSLRGFSVERLFFVTILCGPNTLAIGHRLCAALQPASQHRRRTLPLSRKASYHRAPNSWFAVGVVCRFAISYSSSSALHYIVFSCVSNSDQCSVVQWIFASYAPP